MSVVYGTETSARDTRTDFTDFTDGDWDRTEGDNQSASTDDTQGRYTNGGTAVCRSTLSGRSTTVPWVVDTASHALSASTAWRASTTTCRRDDYDSSATYMHDGRDGTTANSRYGATSASFTGGDGAPSVYTRSAPSTSLTASGQETTGTAGYGATSASFTDGDQVFSVYTRSTPSASFTASGQGTTRTSRYGATSASFSGGDGAPSVYTRGAPSTSLTASGQETTGTAGYGATSASFTNGDQVLSVYTRSTPSASFTASGQGTTKKSRYGATSGSVTGGEQAPSVYTRSALSTSFTASDQETVGISGYGATSASFTGGDEETFASRGGATSGAFARRDWETSASRYGDTTASSFGGGRISDAHAVRTLSATATASGYPPSSTALGSSSLDRSGIAARGVSSRPLLSRDTFHRAMTEHAQTSTSQSPESVVESMPFNTNSGFNTVSPHARDGGAASYSTLTGASSKTGPRMLPSGSIRLSSRGLSTQSSDPRLIPQGPRPTRSPNVQPAEPFHDSWLQASLPYAGPQHPPQPSGSGWPQRRSARSRFQQPIDDSRPTTKHAPSRRYGIETPLRRTQTAPSTDWYSDHQSTEQEGLHLTSHLARTNVQNHSARSVPEAWSLPETDTKRPAWQQQSPAWDRVPLERSPPLADTEHSAPPRSAPPSWERLPRERVLPWIDTERGTQPCSARSSTTAWTRGGSEVPYNKGPHQHFDNRQTAPLNPSSNPDPTPNSHPNPNPPSNRPAFPLRKVTWSPSVPSNASSDCSPRGISLLEPSPREYSHDPQGRDPRARTIQPFSIEHAPPTEPAGSVYCKHECNFTPFADATYLPSVHPTAQHSLPRPDAATRFPGSTASPHTYPISSASRNASVVLSPEEEEDEDEQEEMYSVQNVLKLNALKPITDVYNYHDKQLITHGDDLSPEIRPCPNLLLRCPEVPTNDYTCVQNTYRAHLQACCDPHTNGHSLTEVVPRQIRRAGCKVFLHCAAH